MSKEIGKNSDTYHHGDLRKVLLDNAVKLLHKDGEAGLSMRKLANKAGVSHTAAYHHFADKQALLCAIAEEGFHQFRGILKTDESERTEGVNKAQVYQFVSNYIEFASKNSEYYDVMFGSHLWRTKGLTETLTQEAHGAFRDYVQAVERWRYMSKASSAFDPLRYSQVTWSTLHGACRLLIDGIYVNDQSKKALCDATADMFWRELNFD